MDRKMFLSGNEAVALAAYDAKAHLGTGYPGTPSSEILDEFSKAGGSAQWSPNEKVALEVGIGVALASGRAIVTMKHVGLNVAADPLFTVAYSGTPGGLVIVSADDPGMASSQNEQDNRRYAVAAGIPMLEPADSQEAYDFTVRAFELAEEFRCPVLLRLTTRVCHSKCLVVRGRTETSCPPIRYEKDVKSNVMIPAFARLAHRRLRARLAAIAALNDEKNEFNLEFPGKNGEFGVIVSGISFQYVMETCPDAGVFKIGLTYPLPLKRLQAFASRYRRVIVVEEGDPVVEESCRAAGIPAEGKAEMFRFGELDVGRVRRLIAGDLTPETPPKPGKPPELCPGCPHRKSYEALKALDCIVSGDIGCYTLGVLPPFEAVDSCVCMGASITVGVGLRKALPEAEARRVVSVIGDSTFWHTGINGVVEALYNQPPTGHVIMILDNSITAMTGMQENPGTGRKLDHTPAPKLDLVSTLHGLGVKKVDVVDPLLEQDRLRAVLAEDLKSNEVSVVISRRSCIIAAARIKSYEEKNK